jgi:hypothetical protein
MQLVNIGNTLEGYADFCRGRHWQMRVVYYKELNYTDLPIGGTPIFCRGRHWHMRVVYYKELNYTDVPIGGTPIFIGDADSKCLLRVVYYKELNYTQ